MPTGQCVSPPAKSTVLGPARQRAGRPTAAMNRTVRRCVQPPLKPAPAAAVQWARAFRRVARSPGPFPIRDETTCAFSVHPRPRRGNGFELPATWQAGMQLGRKPIPSPLMHLRTRAELPACLPPERPGPVFSRFLASFPHFALDHTHRPRREAAPPRSSRISVNLIVDQGTEPPQRPCHRPALPDTSELTQPSNETDRSSLPTREFRPLIAWHQDKPAGGLGRHPRAPSRKGIGLTVGG